MRREGKSLAPNFKGGTKKASTQEFIANVSSILAENPNMSKRAIARKFGVSRSTVLRVTAVSTKNARQSPVSD